MRIVLDTNVLLSGLLSPQGVPAQVLMLTLAGELTLLFDERILEEYRDVLLNAAPASTSCACFSLLNPRVAGFAE